MSRYSGFAGLPSVSTLQHSSASSGQVLAGAALGAAGGLGLKYALVKFAPSVADQAGKVNDYVGFESVGAAVTGVALFLAQKNKSSSRAFAHLVGALGAAAVLAVRKLASNFSGGALGDVGDIVQANFGSYGLLVNEQTPRLAGYIVRDKGLAGLRDYALMDSDGYEAGW